MKKDTLRELAVVLYQKVKEDASIVWTIKDSVKAKLKVIVKRILRQYGYPPNVMTQLLALTKSYFTNFKELIGKFSNDRIQQIFDGLMLRYNL
jgi:hypothetical protein